MAGQYHVVRSLTNALDDDRLHHAFLFAGTRGVGKTTVARILAKCLNCERGVTSQPCGTCSACTEIDEGRFIDLIEVDAASRSKVDETRELMENVQFAAARGRYKVYLIDEVHMFSEKSFNALLKTLEEPPPHVKFLLATTDPQKLPITVLSRCLQFNLKRLPVDEIAGYLANITEQEQVTVEPDALRLVARAADGSMRDALSLLDQAIAYGSGRLAVDEVRAMLGTLDQGYLQALLEGLAGADPHAVIATVDEMAGDAVDFDDALAELLSALQRIALAQAIDKVPGLDADEEARLRAFAERMPAEDVQLYYQIALLGRRDLALAPEPRAGFEMTLLRMLAFRPAAALPPPVEREQRGTNLNGPGRADAGDAGQQKVALGRCAITPESWPGIVEQLELMGLARELAVNCAPAEVDNGTVRLRLAPHHEQLTAPGIRDKLRAALERYCETSLRLHIEIAAPGAETPANREERIGAERMARAVHAIESDPGVKAICDTFGASVDRTTIRPVD